MKSTFTSKSKLKAEKAMKEAQKKKAPKPGSSEEKHNQALSMNNKASKEIYAMAMDGPSDPPKEHKKASQANKPKHAKTSTLAKKAAKPTAPAIQEKVQTPETLSDEPSTPEETAKAMAMLEKKQRESTMMDNLEKEKIKQQILGPQEPQELAAAKSIEQVTDADMQTLTPDQIKEA